MMPKFDVVKKGYDIAQVNNYLTASVQSDKDALSEKSIRIEELKAENAALLREIEQLKKREKNVNEALMTAIEKAKEMDYSTKIRFALEGERIKLFRDKWLNYCDKNIQDTYLQKKRGEVSGALMDIEEELVEAMSKDMDLQVSRPENEVQAQYMEEAKRIISKARKTAGVKHEESTAATFNLNELNNPPELEDICKQLGLMA